MNINKNELVFLVFILCVAKGILKIKKQYYKFFFTF